jgi:excisionase family DNA binding protein
MDTTLQSEWLTAAEAAAYLKVKTRSLLLWVRQGKVPAYALSGTVRRVWRFRKEDLDLSLLSKAVVSSAQSSSVRSPERSI